jgi:hypothetical protein
VDAEAGTIARHRAEVRARVAELQELSAREVQLDKAYVLRALMKNLSMALGEVPTFVRVVVGEPFTGGTNVNVLLGHLI